MNELLLEGCTATPLANYLKALGVLRLLSTHYPETRGSWRGDRFVLLTPLTREGIEQFFLDEYAPTPLVAPWGARSGFYRGSSEKTARDALAQIEASSCERLATFKSMIESVRELLDQHGFDEKASDERKVELMRICRGELQDHLIEWLDTCYILSGDDRKFPPLLGTGGNEGSGSYVSGFAQQIVACVHDRLHDAALAAALFDANVPGTTVDQTPGHFAPVSSGGVNASVGFDDDKAQTNPWSYILALEGSVALAGAAVRRNANDPTGGFNYPFTVYATFAGAGSLGEGDANKPRGEMWLPLWNQPCRYVEIRNLMNEGRVVLGRKPAHDGLDFVRALHHFGGYRGIHSFQRFGLLKRNGKSYFATALSRIDVSESPAPSWLDELDTHGWLEKLRRFANDSNTAARFKTLRKRLEDALFALSGKTPGKPEAQALLVLLGQIQSALASSSKAREAVRPVPRLSERWVIAADDGTPVLRIAKALAGLRGVGEVPLPIRTQLFPVERSRAKWITPESGESHRLCDGFEGRLTNTLPTLLARRLWLAERFGMNDKPLESPAGATLSDLAAFLRDDGMDARIADLLPGLALCDIPQEIDRSGGEGGVPAAYALMKLALTPERTLRSLGALADGQSLPAPAGMLAQLAAGNHGNRAVAIAWRRLRASGLSPRFTHDALPTLAGIDPKRAAAALLIPLRYGATAALARSTTKQPEPDFA